MDFVAPGQKTGVLIERASGQPAGLVSDGLVATPETNNNNLEHRR